MTLAGPGGPVLEGAAIPPRPTLLEEDMQTYYQMPLDELCALMIATTRAFIDDFPINDVSADALELGSLRRSLDGMTACAGLPRRDSADIEILSAALERELERETLGWIAVFDGVIDPEIGAVGDARDVREVTPRGRMIDDHVRALRHIAHIRSICRARLAAEELLMKR